MLHHGHAKGAGWSPADKVAQNFAKGGAYQDGQEGDKTAKQRILWCRASLPRSGDGNGSVQQTSDALWVQKFCGMQM